MKGYQSICLQGMLWDDLPAVDKKSDVRQIKKEWGKTLRGKKMWKIISHAVSFTKNCLQLYNLVFRLFKSLFYIPHFHHIQQKPDDGILFSFRSAEIEREIELQESSRGVLSSLNLPGYLASDAILMNGKLTPHLVTFAIRVHVSPVCF